MPSLQSQIRWCARGQWAMGCVIVGLASAFALLVYRPTIKRLDHLHTQIAQRQRDVFAGRAETKVLPDVAGEVQRLQARLDRSNKSIPDQPELPQFIRDVTQLSQQGNLKKFSFVPKDPRRGEQVCELPIQLNFEGDFTNVFAFLRNAEEMPRLTRVRGMTIKSRDKGGNVAVQLTMNIYFSAE